MSRLSLTQRLSSNVAISAPGADTDAITDVTFPGKQLCRVTIQVATSTVVNLMVLRSGSSEVALGLNANTALTAACLYVFDVPGLLTDDTVNVQVETDSVIDFLAIDAVPA